MNDTDSNWEDLFEQLPLEPTAREEHRRPLKQQVLDAFDDSQSLPDPKLKRIGQTLMKYKMPQLTAAAIAIVVAASTLNFGGTAFAIENVVAKLVKAKSARWESVVDLGALGKRTIKTIIIPGRSRTENQDGSIMIHDWKSGKALSLSPASKTALQLNLGKESKELDSVNVFQIMKDSLSASMKSERLGNAESLGSKSINGRSLTGFRVNGEGEITIWADPKTEVAVQIEIQMETDGLAVVMKNYEADFPVDESLFSLDIPDGYQTTEVNLPTVLPSESEFIRSLKLGCECCDGMFPPALDITSTSKISVDINMHLMKSMKLSPTGATGQQIAELARATMGFSFVTVMAVNKESDAHYAGANVKLGEKDRPIFWYKPRRSEQYRVIFADLTVRQSDSAPEVENAVKLAP